MNNMIIHANLLISANGAAECWRRVGARARVLWLREAARAAVASRPGRRTKTLDLGLLNKVRLGGVERVREGLLSVFRV